MHNLQMIYSRNKRHKLLLDEVVVDRDLINLRHHHLGECISLPSKP